MFSWLINKLFLVKEIRSRDDVLHFLRYRLASTRWFTVYVHKICESDQDLHMHDHPFDFTSIILKGSYQESYAEAPHWADIKTRVLRRGNAVSHDHLNVHKIKVVDGPVWTLVFTGAKRYEWGYQTASVGWIDHERYRVLKNAGKLPK